ncbi:Acidic phosphoprotein precursor PCEMA1, putative [Plasmodium chabaudi adami]|uniref:Acidic phosphoprotein PCEMA1, putative n=1 Tax=Plasmodium chabaudi adami TaxID=5826 RepID=A0A1C6WPC2_PLACE|nr:Acidic phosphoprotein precursor PCEMA1, putative [Plasmodium chabaudi adami]
MKTISLALISSTIFNIVLAKKWSGSKSTTGCFPFCRKKTKKIYKIDEPVKVKGKGAYDPDIPNIKFIGEFDPIIFEVHEEWQTGLTEPFTSEIDGTTVDKVTGFLRRENNSIKKGWYIRSYEEEPEDMINDNFTPLNRNHRPFQSNQKNAHKQDCTALVLSNAPENQGPSTMHEDEELHVEFEFFSFSFPRLGITLQGVFVQSSLGEIQGLGGQRLLDLRCIELSI